MRRLLSLASAAVILAGLAIATPGRSRAQSDSILVAAPPEGHSGDTVYLSGSGLPPHHTLFLMMACPNWHSPTVSMYGNIKFQQNGPTTDGRGSFRAFPFQVLTLRHYRSAGCQIYTSDGANFYGPDFPATYLILRPDDPGSHCMRQLCASVHASPSRVHGGAQERIQIQTWAGATAQIAVSYGSGPTLRLPLQVNLKGIASVRLRVPDLHSGQSLTARIVASAHIGTKTGKGKGTFTVVR